MSETKQRLTTAFLRLGQSKLAEIWEVDSTTAGKRLTEHLNISLSDFCKALDALGIQLVTPDSSMVLIKTEKLHALQILANEALNPVGERRGQTDRRQG